jgi:hypothetical protein
LVRHQTDSYFVRLDVDPPGGHAPVGTARGRYGPVGREGLGAPARKRHRRRRRPSGKAVLIVLLVIGLAAWVGWAQQRPGGISGTVNGWISKVRGDVAKVSSDPDFGKATKYYNAQYTKSHAYPQMSDSDLAAVGVGVGVNVEWCNAQAVVIQGAQGGTTVSRLLDAGQDLGVQPAKFGCPADLSSPTPWKAP